MKLITRMARPASTQPTDTELEILNVLWDTQFEPLEQGVDLRYFAAEASGAPTHYYDGRLGAQRHAQEETGSAKQGAPADIASRRPPIRRRRRRLLGVS